MCRKKSIFISMSIDGYIAGPDGELDWLQRVDLEGEDYGYSAFLESIDAIVLGRNTYEVAQSASKWPYQGKRVVVLSRTLSSVREEAELFCGDIPLLVSALYSDGVQAIWVDGGLTISQFLQHKLVDQLIISVIPVILGAGIPLFSNPVPSFDCRLLSTRAYPTGLVQLSYEIVK